MGHACIELALLFDLSPFLFVLSEVKLAEHPPAKEQANYADMPKRNCLDYKNACINHPGVAQKYFVKSKHIYTYSLLVKPNKKILITQDSKQKTLGKALRRKIPSKTTFVG